MPSLAALQPLVGRWSTEITMLHPPEQHGETSHAVDTYRFLPGDNILVHEVEARMGGEAVISIEIYSARGGQITARSFDSHGGVTDYKAALTDGVFRIDGETERLTSKAITPDLVEGLWQTRTDDGWIDWMTVRLHRIT